jgi:hypothetical protein
MTAPIASTSAQARYDYEGYGRYGGERNKGDSYLAFAIVLLGIAGVLNLIGGIAAISNSHFYTQHAHYVISNLKTWGWVVTIIGGLQLLVAYGVYQRNQAARWTAVVLLSLNAIASLLMIPAYPFWSLSIFALDIIALYGLIAYGQKPETPAT